MLDTIWKSDSCVQKYCDSAKKLHPQLKQLLLVTKRLENYLMLRSRGGDLSYHDYELLAQATRTEISSVISSSGDFSDWEEIDGSIVFDNETNCAYMVNCDYNGWVNLDKVEVALVVPAPTETDNQKVRDVQEETYLEGLAVLDNIEYS